MEIHFFINRVFALFANTPISDRVNLYISELQKSQIPPALEQNRCYSVFSKITNLLIFHPLYRPFFGLFTHFSKIPNFWNCISLHFGFFGPKFTPEYHIEKKNNIWGDIFLKYFFKFRDFDKISPKFEKNRIKYSR